MADWLNRIVEYGNADPEQLLANPNNWRIHPVYQQEALNGLLDEVGWVDDVIVNRRTGFVLDGHLRVMQAMKRAMKSMPVAYVELSDAEESEVLATLDAIGALANTDGDKLIHLTELVQTADDGLLALLGTLAQQDPTDMTTVRKKVKKKKGARPLRVQMGAFRFLVSEDEFTEWERGILAEVGEDGVKAEVFRRLGIPMEGESDASSDLA